jgi:hypothetical protein
MTIRFASPRPATGTAGKVIAYPRASYFSTVPDDRLLVLADNPRIGAMRFEDWFSQPSLQRR